MLCSLLAGKKRGGAKSFSWRSRFDVNGPFLRPLSPPLPGVQMVVRGVMHSESFSHRPSAARDRVTLLLARVTAGRRLLFHAVYRFFFFHLRKSYIW
ncbi:hypothetical protein NPIL_245821 [Nephila pilipes]|uniref:Uncharacterized protein n=1 Tax=Nephila pilipes TaxID=299642 RepID=A0A8X6MDK5_NEPPI|nr:hypothetical protein NPIL_245821 [Nephila pilipes]